MKTSKIVRILALSVLLALLIPLLPTSVHAAEYLTIFPREARISDYLELDGRSFRENDSVFIYITSQKVTVGDVLDEDVTAYEFLFNVNTDENGSFERVYSFLLPDALTDGADVEDVHNGPYYLFGIYHREIEIAAVDTLLVLNGEISLDIEEDTIGTEVEISGVGLRPNQAITIQYDEHVTGIVSGGSQSDKNGDFSCTIIIPESTAGIHTITAIDESGNTPEAPFNVLPMITTDPTEQFTGGEVQVSGTGFAARGDITITFDGNKVTTTPSPLVADHFGSFEGSFIVPASGSYGSLTVEAYDKSANVAETSLAIRGGIRLLPTTSPASPGYAGMELVVLGTGFSSGATATVTYSDNGQDITVATAEVKDGAFRAVFIVPESMGGSHDITADDGTSTATATFIMEAQAPSTPILLSPEVAGTTGAKAHFDWLEVSDDSGVSYTLQVAIDPDFNVILLNKTGLEDSEYTLSQEERLETIQEDDSFYWRVKAVDGALNESGWANPRLFYIGFSWSALPTWAWYVLGIVAFAALATASYWLWKKVTKSKGKTI